MNLLIKTQSASLFIKYQIGFLKCTVSVWNSKQKQSFRKQTEFKINIKAVALFAMLILALVSFGSLSPLSDSESESKIVKKGKLIKQFWEIFFKLRFIYSIAVIDEIQSSR